MKFFKPRNLICLSVLTLLFACGDSNPLLGKWAPVTKIAAYDGSVFPISSDSMPVTTFTRSEVIFELGSNKYREKIKYRKDADKVWSVTNDGGKNWGTIKILDQDYIVQDFGLGMEITMQRVK
jgi:hypothetical protein